MPTASELRELDDDELEGRLSEYRRELLNLRFQLGTGQLDNVSRLSQVRRDVARVLTVLRDREIALAEGRDAGPVISSRPPRRPRAERVAVAEPEEDFEVEPEVDTEPEVDVEPEPDTEPDAKQAPKRRATRSRRAAAESAEEVDSTGESAHGEDAGGGGAAEGEDR